MKFANEIFKDKTPDCCHLSFCIFSTIENLLEHYFPVYAIGMWIETMASPINLYSVLARGFIMLDAARVWAHRYCHTDLSPRWPCHHTGFVHGTRTQVCKRVNWAGTTPICKLRCIPVINFRRNCKQLWNLDRMFAIWGFYVNFWKHYLRFYHDLLSDFNYLSLEINPLINK